MAKVVKQKLQTFQIAPYNECDMVLISKVLRYDTGTLMRDHTVLPVYQQMGCAFTP